MCTIVPSFPPNYHSKNFASVMDSKKKEKRKLVSVSFVSGYHSGREGCTDECGRRD
jgi:hypothetical protein